MLLFTRLRKFLESQRMHRNVPNRSESPGNLTPETNLYQPGATVRNMEMLKVSRQVYSDLRDT